MKAQTKALVASLIIVALGLSAVSGVTYSWFSDSEQAEISVTTATFNVEQNLGNPTINPENGGITEASTSGNRIQINNLVGGTEIQIPIEVKYTSTIKVVSRTVVEVNAPGFDGTDKDKIKINGQSLSSIGTMLVLKDWESQDAGVGIEIFNSILSISTTGWSTMPSSMKALSMTVKTEMYQGNYMTEGFSGETEIFGGVVSGHTSGDSQLPITVDFTGAIGVSNGMTFKAASKSSSGTFSVSDGSSTKAIIDLTLMDEEGSVSFGGEVKVTVKVSGDVITGTSGPLSVIYDGTIGGQPTLVSATYDSGTDKTTIVFTTTHFSDFVIYTGIPVDSHGIYCIYNADQLFELNKDVNERNNGYNRQVVKLMADIDLEGKPWTPLGRTGGPDGHPFYGTFEGNNKTIYGLKVLGPSNNSKDGASGFFGWLDGKVNDLTISGAEIEGNHYTGGIAGYIQDSSGDVSIKGCKVIDSKITSAFADSDRSGDKVGGIVGFIEEGSKVIDNTVENVTITGCRDVGAIAGIAYVTENFKNNTIKGENKIILTPVEDKEQYNIRDFVGRHEGSFTTDSSNHKVSGASVERICHVSDIDQLGFILDACGKNIDASLNGIVIKLMDDLTYISEEVWNPGKVDNDSTLGVFEGGSIVIDGNEKTITGLNGALIPQIYNNFEITIKGLTLKDSLVSGGDGIQYRNDEYFSAGAFIAELYSSVNVKIIGCHVIDAKIGGGNVKWAGGFVGHAEGTGVLTIQGSSVSSSSDVGTQIQAKGSVGGMIGHTAMKTNMRDNSVKGCTIVTTDDKNHIGTVIGTVNIGGCSITIGTGEVSGNELTADGSKVDDQNEWGRFVAPPGSVLTVNGENKVTPESREIYSRS